MNQTMWVLLLNWIILYGLRKSYIGIWIAVISCLLILIFPKNPKMTENDFIAGFCFHLLAIYLLWKAGYLETEIICILYIASMLHSWFCCNKDKKTKYANLLAWELPIMILCPIIEFSYLYQQKSVFLFILYLCRFLLTRELQQKNFIFDFLWIFLSCHSQLFGINQNMHLEIYFDFFVFDNDDIYDFKQLSNKIFVMKSFVVSRQPHILKMQILNLLFLICNSIWIFGLLIQCLTEYYLCFTCFLIFRIVEFPIFYASSFFYGCTFDKNVMLHQLKDKLKKYELYLIIKSQNLVCPDIADLVVTYI